MSPEPNDPYDREDAPFLSADSPPDDHHQPKPPRREPPNGVHNIRFRLMVTLFAIVLAVEMGFIMANGPMMRISESIVCRKYYREHDPDQFGADGHVEEQLCKINEVQSEMAAVQGYMEFFDALLSVFLAIPYGLLADRRGRKSTICLSIPGFALNNLMVLSVLWFSDILPLRAMWFASLAWLLGGGPVVVFAITWTMMADVTTEDERASIFFKFGVASMAADFISSAVSSWLMAMNPWLPLMIGMGMATCGTFLNLSLPETIHVRPQQPPEQAPVELSQLDPDRHKELSRKYSYEDGDEVIDYSPHGRVFTPAAARRSWIATLWLRIRSYISPYLFLFRNKQILVLLTAFLVYRLSRGSSWFLVQYISLRFNWTLAMANFLMSFKPALTIPLFLFGLPAVRKYLLRSMPTREKDLRLAQISIIFLALGTLGIGLSSTLSTLIPSLLLQTSGAGFVYLIRSLITTLVKREETARLFTVTEILQSVGNVIASLSITTVFQLGLKIGGMWTGLAWMMTSMAFCVVGVAIWTFKIPPAVQENSDVESHAS